MSPVENRGTPRYVDSFAACVPLPAPGGPNRTRRMRVTERAQRSKDLRLDCHSSGQRKRDPNIHRERTSSSARQEGLHMRIGVIGAGHIGGTAATLFAAAGHE